MPSNFPSGLKKLVLKGCSKKPQKRPLIKKFQSALHKMRLTEEQSVPQEEEKLTLDEDTPTECTNVQAGYPFKSLPCSVDAELSTKLFFYFIDSVAFHIYSHNQLF